MSFEEENIQILQQELYPCLYLSTLIVKKESRRKCIAYMLYKELFDIFPDKDIITRKWSTNISHINLLEKLGFCVLNIIKDDRGKGIDTIYFRRFSK